MRSVKALLGSVLVFIVLVVTAAPGRPQPIKIRLTHFQVEQQPLGIYSKRFAAEINKELAGKVDLRVYPAAQLYGPVADVQAVRKGDVEMGFVISDLLGSLNPAIDVMNLPYLVPEEGLFYKILDGPVGEKIFAPMEAKGVKVLVIASFGSISVSTRTKVVKTPADFGGLKVRAYSKMSGAIVQHLGAKQTMIPGPEVYTALQQGVLDGVYTPLSVFLDRRYHEVLKYLTVTNRGFIQTGTAVIANKKFWDSLPAEVRSRMEAIIQRVVRQEMRPYVDDDDRIIEIAKAKGVTVHKLTPAEQKLWQKVTKPMYEEYAERIGKDIIKAVQDERARLLKAPR